MFVKRYSSDGVDGRGFDPETWVRKRPCTAQINPENDCTSAMIPTTVSCSRGKQILSNRWFDTPTDSYLKGMGVCIRHTRWGHPAVLFVDRHHHRTVRLQFELSRGAGRVG